jgi:hypothetical protein
MDIACFKYESVRVSGSSWTSNPVNTDFYPSEKENLKRHHTPNVTLVMLLKDIKIECDWEMKRKLLSIDYFPNE